MIVTSAERCNSESSHHCNRFIYTMYIFAHESSSMIAIAKIECLRQLNLHHYSAFRTSTITGQCYRRRDMAMCESDVHIRML